VSDNPQAFTDFPIEFYNDTEVGNDHALFVEAEESLRALAKGHSDIVGASVNLTQPSQNNATPYIFEATVIAYTRPQHIAATEKAGDLRGALRGALQAVERQVRAQRERLRDY
jgi:ribosome-associated translation inhibitor RaiA